MAATFATLVAAKLTAGYLVSGVTDLTINERNNIHIPPSNKMRPLMTANAQDKKRTRSKKWGGRKLRRPKHY